MAERTRFPGAVRACRDCGQMIGWCVTVNDRPLPVDLYSNDDGNVVCQWENGRVVGRVPHKGEARPDGVAFMPHAATCSAKQSKKPAGTRPAKRGGPDGQQQTLEVVD